MKRPLINSEVDSSEIKSHFNNSLNLVSITNQSQYKFIKKPLTAEKSTFKAITNTPCTSQHNDSLSRSRRTYQSTKNNIEIESKSFDSSKYKVNNISPKKKMQMEKRQNLVRKNIFKLIRTPAISVTIFLFL